MGSRKDDVRALLDRAQRDLNKLEADYTASLSARMISPDLRIDIKNICGNLRSILDYLAGDVREKCCPTANPNARFYFPVFPARTDFEGQTRTCYPGLETARPDVWHYLESVQPYHAAYEWLGQLNQINNENKHDNLVQQTRTEAPRVTVTTPGGGMVSWDPRAVRFGSGVFIGGVPVDPRTQMPVPHPSITVQQVIWVDFRFKDPDVSAIGLLKEGVKGIGEISTELETLV